MALVDLVRRGRTAGRYASRLDPTSLATFRIVLAAARLPGDISEEQQYLASLIPS